METFILFPKSMASLLARLPALPRSWDKAMRLALLIAPGFLLRPARPRRHGSGTRLIEIPWPSPRLFYEAGKYP